VSGYQEDDVKLSPFRMERWQSTYEHRVRYNLSESGVHPLSVTELLDLAGRTAGDLLDARLGYGQSNGSDLLRERIAALYPGADESNVLVTVGGAEANFAGFWHLMEPRTPAAVSFPNYMQVPGSWRTSACACCPFISGRSIAGRRTSTSWSRPSPPEPGSS